MKKLLLLSGFLLSLSVMAQNEAQRSNRLNLEAEVEASVFVSNEDEIPFWFYTNSNRSVGNETHISSTATIVGSYSFGEASVEAGVAGYYRDGVTTDHFQRRDLYARFQNTWLKVTAGAKKQDVVLDGLTTSNKNFLWSGNARPLPGLIVEANDPIKISKTFSIDWGIAHYVLNDNDIRFVDNTWVHYKRLGLNVQLAQHHKITARLQHFAQWAGTSESEGELLNNAGAFFDVFLAKRSNQSTEAGEQRNAIGNHLGSYFLEYIYNASAGDFSFYHEHPFEDGSGTRLANFPDGIWGISFQRNKKGILNTIVYEYVDTSDQSGDTSQVSGSDGYFGNNIYRSGWTYEDQVIGVPFILLDPTIEQTPTNSKFISNRSRVHHLGAGGSVRSFDWQVKLTHATFLGRYQRPINPVLRRTFTYGSLAYTFEKMGALRAFAGVDLTNNGNTIAGGGLQYKYTF